MTGLVGIRARADDVLEINPLLPEADDAQALRWFRVENVPYHGHHIAVTWDADGRRYGAGRGLSIEVDGREIARRATLGRLSIPVARKANDPISREFNAAVQLVRGQFPKPSASSNDMPERLQDAVDGRVWFMPELPNGWTSVASNKLQWYAIDFGKPTRLTAAEIAFFADGRHFATPDSMNVQIWLGGSWQTITRRPLRPLANGVTRLDWPAIETDRIRVLMMPRRGRSIRLIEFKALTSTDDQRIRSKF